MASVTVRAEPRREQVPRGYRRCESHVLHYGAHPVAGEGAASCGYSGIYQLRGTGILGCLFKKCREREGVFAVQRSDQLQQGCGQDFLAMNGPAPNTL